MDSFSVIDGLNQNTVKIITIVLSLSTLVTGVSVSLGINEAQDFVLYQYPIDLVGTPVPLGLAMIAFAIITVVGLFSNHFLSIYGSILQGAIWMLAVVLYAIAGAYVTMLILAVPYVAVFSMISWYCTAGWSH